MKRSGMPAFAAAVALAWLWAVLVAVLVAGGWGPTAWGEDAEPPGDPEKGRKISETHCSRCHVVGDYNPTGGISSTPSFQLLVKRRPDWRERFATFYARRPHPAFLSITGIGRPMAHLPPNAAPVELPLSALRHIVAFAETLRPKPKADGRHGGSRHDGRGGRVERGGHVRRGGGT